MSGTPATVGLHGIPNSDIRAPAQFVEDISAHIACGDACLFTACNDQLDVLAGIRIAASIKKPCVSSTGAPIELATPVCVWTPTRGLEICQGSELVSTSTGATVSDQRAEGEATRNAILRLNDAMKTVCTGLGADVQYIEPPQKDGTMLSMQWKNPMMAMRAIAALAPDTFSRLIVVFYGLGELLNCPNVMIEAVKLRDTVAELVRTSALTSSNTKRVIYCVIPEKATLSDAVAHCFTEIVMPLPTAAELMETKIQFLTACLEGRIAGTPGAISEEIKQAMAAAATGLPRDEAVNTMFMAVYRARNTLDMGTVRILNDLRCKSIARHGSLTFYSDDQLTKPDDMAGIDILRSDMRDIAQGFTADGPALNLHKEIGIVLTGISGTGKSAFATAAASILSDVTKQVWPVVSLDVGSLFSKHIGESEANWRRTMAQIKAIGRVVVILDECEKALAGASTTASDGGLTKRLFSSMLTWLNDLRRNHYECFVVATMNDQTHLPPEFFQRFANTYFADLPDPQTRVEIAKIKYRMQLAPLGVGIETMAWTPAQWNAVGQAFTDFSGREIEKAVTRSRNVAAAHKQPHAIPTHQQLLDIIEVFKPSISANADKEVLARIREWSASRARPIGISATPVIETTPPQRTSTRNQRRSFDGPSAN